MGPPGAGKGTQAKRLVEKFNVVHLSSGDILRAEKAGGSALGKELAAYMDAGKLVPDDTVVSVMAKALTESATGGLLLDGFPRTVPQAKSLDMQLAKAGKPLDAVIVMSANADLIVARIVGRRSCPACGRVYHATNMPPKRDGVCDECGGTLIHRDDDKESVVRQRLDAYLKQTEPVIAYYRTQPKLRIVDVDGTLPADTVTAQMAQALQAIQGK